MARFVDRLVQDGLDTPIDVVVDPIDSDLVDVRHRRLCHHWRLARRQRDGVPASSDLSSTFLAEIDDCMVLLANEARICTTSASAGPSPRPMAAT